LCLISAVVPTGATADIVATGFDVGGDWEDATVVVFSAYGFASTRTWTNNAVGGTSATSVSLTTTVPSGGFGVALCRAPASTVSWNLGVRQYDAAIAGRYGSVVLVQDTLTSGTLTASWSTGTSNVRIAGVSFAKA
jgi:hypothetical protein